MLSTSTLTLSFRSAASAALSAPSITTAKMSHARVALMSVPPLRLGPLLLNNAIGAEQRRPRHLKAEPLRGLQIHDELDAVRELDGDLAGGRPREDLMRQPGGPAAPEDTGRARR